MSGPTCWPWRESPSSWTEAPPTSLRLIPHFPLGGREGLTVWLWPGTQLPRPQFIPRQDGSRDRAPLGLQTLGSLCGRPGPAPTLLPDEALPAQLWGRSKAASGVKRALNAGHPTSSGKWGCFPCKAPQEHSGRSPSGAGGRGAATTARGHWGGVESPRICCFPPACGSPPAPQGRRPVARGLPTGPTHTRRPQTLHLEPRIRNRSLSGVKGSLVTKLSSRSLRGREGCQRPTFAEGGPPGPAHPAGSAALGSSLGGGPRRGCCSRSPQAPARFSRWGRAARPPLTPAVAMPMPQRPASRQGEPGHCPPCELLASHCAPGRRRTLGFHGNAPSSGAVEEPTKSEGRRLGPCHLSCVSNVLVGFP